MKTKSNQNEMKVGCRLDEKIGGNEGELRDSGGMSVSRMYYKHV